MIFVLWISVLAEIVAAWMLFPFYILQNEAGEKGIVDSFWEKRPKNKRPNSVWFLLIHAAVNRSQR